MKKNPNTRFCNLREFLFFSFILFSNKLIQNGTRMLFNRLQSVQTDACDGLTAGTKQVQTALLEDKYKKAEKQFSAGIRQDSLLSLRCGDCSHKRIGFQSKSEK